MENITNTPEDQQFKESYPHGLAEWVPFIDKEGRMVIYPDVIAQKMTEVITKRGNMGYKLLEVNDLPDRPGQGKFLFFVPKE